MTGDEEVDRLQNVCGILAAEQLTDGRDGLFQALNERQRILNNRISNNIDVHVSYKLMVIEDYFEVLHEPLLFAQLVGLLLFLCRQ